MFGRWLIGHFVICVVLRSLSPRHREEIDKFTQQFNRFKQQFDRGIAVQSASTLEMLLENIGLFLHLSFSTIHTDTCAIASMKYDNLLEELKPKNSVRGRPTAECMDGTREDILVEIGKWCDELDASNNILWVSGFPGVGKSAIARKLAARLKSSHRLGSSFFFQRELATIQTPANLWRTIAFDLARQYPSARNTVIDKLKNDEVDPETANADELFLSLVKEPLKHCTDIPSGRLPVIIIDALDECGGFDGSRSKYRTILLLGIKAWACLPSRFKLVLTSRLEDDIFRMLSPISYPIELVSGPKVRASSSRDIRLFLNYEFARITNKYTPSLPSGWPGAETVESFTKRAAGLFIYADTLIKFVDEGQPVEQLQRVLLEPVYHENLTHLYRQILTVSFKNPSPTVLEQFRNVTGTIILAKTPLRRQDLIDLLDMEPIALNHICQGLRSVLDTGDLLRFTHQSFVDFLMTSEGCHPPFLFHMANQSSTLLLASLHVMKNELRFNICQLETSHAVHDDIPDLELRVHDAIPPHLQYACCFWTDHRHPVFKFTSLRKWRIS